MCVCHGSDGPDGHGGVNVDELLDLGDQIMAARRHCDASGHFC